MKWKRLTIATLIFVSILVFVAWFAGAILTAPIPREIGKLPQDLSGMSVDFRSESGSQIHGWLIPGQGGRGLVIIMHGVRASRLDMLGRARFLSRAGYAVLLFDFQAHGESPGQQITFGYLESRDARAALAFARSVSPHEKIGVIGVSMGGAAALLAEPPLSIDGLVVEQVYPTMHDAISDRISMRWGAWSRALTPLLSWQLRPRLGVSDRDLRPLDHVRKIICPKLFVGGESDRHTTPKELRRMFDAAAEPKELWIVPQAKHVDLSRFAKGDYERRILSFFSKHLSATP
ncbi:MAG: alpha/beta fold hydrolase [Chthoniobacterales bacterium]